MIPRDYVTRWRARAPWAIDAQVEQDLVISRALELFRTPGVAGRLAFRGGTALYQRRKGRDLFDLWYASKMGSVDPRTVVACFRRYMAEGGHAVSRAQLEANLRSKQASDEFREGMTPLLRPGLSWDVDLAMKAARDRLVALIPGEPWRGSA